MPVCPLVYLKDHTSKPHEIFCALCPWLGPFLTTVQYAMYALAVLWMVSCLAYAQTQSDSGANTALFNVVVLRCL